MDRLQLLEMAARARQAADECERLKAPQARELLSLRAAGKSTAELEAILSQLEADCDRHMAEMERVLDQLDRGAPTSEPRTQ